MRDCKRIHNQIHELLDGELSPLRRAWLRFHLWICTPCRRVEHSTKFTVNTLQALRDAPPIKSPPDET